MIYNRIRVAKPYFAHLRKGEKYILGVSDPEGFGKVIGQLGFSEPLNPGDSVLPDVSYGKWTAENALGWTEVHRDQPMETYYQTREWTWRMKRGWDYEEESKIVDVPHKRYPRTVHPPLALELQVCASSSGDNMIVLPEFEKGREDERTIKTAVNMLVEIFGRCEIFSTNLETILKSPIKRLNWRLLPPGRRPWEQLKKELKAIAVTKGGYRDSVVSRRFEVLNRYGPEFYAVGQHGFTGYVVFGYPQHNMFILESNRLGNATYVLGKKWEQLSKLTKRELISGGLHDHRIVHRADWESHIHWLFHQKEAA